MNNRVEEDNQSGFPESWPTYRTVATVLRGILQQCRAGEPPDKRTILALAWKTSSLGTFASGLRKLGRRHTAAPEEPKWKLLEEQLQEEMAIARSPSSITTVLSAATWAVSMGTAKHTVPRSFGQYVKGEENAWDDRKVLWGLGEALQTIGCPGQAPYRVGGGGSNGTVDGGGTTRRRDGRDQGQRTGSRHDHVLGR